MKKISVLASALMISISAIAAENDKALLFPYILPNAYLSGMSDNGKWGLFKFPDYSEEDAVPRRMNLSTGIIEDMPIDADQNSWGSICVCYDITDDGEMIVGSYNDHPAYYFNGEWNELPLPAKARGFTGNVYSVTPDGSMMCGWIAKSFTEFLPVIWKDGELVEIGQTPTYEEMFERGIIDGGDYSEHLDKGQTPNLAFFKISADGKQVLSGVDHNYPAWGASYIVYHVETGTYDWIADDSIHGDTFVDGAAMSDNGEWISANISATEYYGDGSWGNVSYPARYHVPTAKFERGKGGGSFIGNDGTSWRGGVPCGNVTVPVDKILKQRYGIDFKEVTGYQTTGSAFAVSSDERTILAQVDAREHAYSITLPIPLREAAEGINLLSEWECFPPAATPLSHLLTIQLRLSGSCTYDGKSVATLSKGDETLATTTEISGRGNVYVLTFPETILSPGEEYTVTCPEGMFEVKANGSRSPLISISYTGREDTPLSPYEIVPREGSSVIEFGAYNMITMKFPTLAAATPDAAAYLYEKGAKDPLAKLAIISDGTTVYAYPAATRRLSKGKEYVVRFPQGAVTDLAGFCGNEEFEVAYKGSYQATPPETGSEYLFFDDFSSPNDSQGNFLLYEGDHLPPNSEMQAFGFDSDNTPWNFTIRDDEEYDYCAAATSFHTAEGAADDWMVIPQLTIPNEYNYLTFKSQSFSFHTTDRLKVIVWESDEVLGSLDSETIRRMREEGTVVYDEIEHPGNEMSVLAGDWKENTISLAQWTGKKIYIAFVNENDHQSMVFVDDIAVVYRGNYTLTATMPTTLVEATSTPVAVKLTMLNDRSADTVSATLFDADDKEISHLDFSDLGLTSATPLEFTFPEEFPLVPGKITPLRIEVAVNGETRNLDLSISSLAFEPRKRVLVEEGTGAWCGWCPLGMIALDYLEATYPDNIVEIAIHNDDIYAFAAYDQFLAFGGYPNGRVNRSHTTASPTTVENGTYSLSSSTGDVTFMDFVEQALATPAEIGIELSSLKLTPAAAEGDSHKVSLGIDVTPALDKDADYNLFIAMTEDGLPGLQTNNLSGSTDPLLAEWGARDPNTWCVYNSVARAVLSSGFYGDSGLLPSAWTAGKTVHLDLDLAMPAVEKDINKVNLVAVLINPESGDAVNAAVINMTKASGTDMVNDSSEGHFSVADGSVLFNGSKEGVEIFNLQGFKVDNRNLKGTYIALHGNRSIKIHI